MAGNHKCKRKIDELSKKVPTKAPFCVQNVYPSPVFPISVVDLKRHEVKFAQCNAKMKILRSKYEGEFGHVKSGLGCSVPSVTQAKRHYTNLKHYLRAKYEGEFGHVKTGMDYSVPSVTQAKRHYANVKTDTRHTKTIVQRP